MKKICECCGKLFESVEGKEDKKEDRNYQNYRLEKNCKGLESLVTWLKENGSKIDVNKERWAADKIAELVTELQNFMKNMNLMK